MFTQLHIIPEIIKPRCKALYALMLSIGLSVCLFVRVSVAWNSKDISYVSSP